MEQESEGIIPKKLAEEGSEDQQPEEGPEDKRERLTEEQESEGSSLSKAEELDLSTDEDLDDDEEGGGQVDEEWKRGQRTNSLRRSPRTKE